MPKTCGVLYRVPPIVICDVCVDCSNYRSFGESGLLENEPTAPAEQAHTPHGGESVKSKNRHRDVFCLALGVRCVAASFFRLRRHSGNREFCRLDYLKQPVNTHAADLRVDEEVAESPPETRLCHPLSKLNDRKWLHAGIGFRRT